MLRFNKLVESLLAPDNTKLFRVSHYGLGIDTKTYAKNKNEAMRNVFFRLKKEGILKTYDYNKFMNSTVKAI